MKFVIATVKLIASSGDLWDPIINTSGSILANQIAPVHVMAEQLPDW